MKKLRRLSMVVATTSLMFVLPSLARAADDSALKPPPGTGGLKPSQ